MDKEFMEELKKLEEEMNRAIIDKDRKIISDIIYGDLGVRFDPFWHGWLCEYENIMQLEAPSDTYILEMEEDKDDNN